MKTEKNRGQSGLTLLEVMLAVTLIAVGVIPLLVTHGAAVRSFIRSRETTAAGLLAQERISLLEADGYREVHHWEESLATPPRLAWEETIAPVRPELLASLEVRVRGGEGRTRPAARELELATYLVNPRYAPPSEEEDAGEEDPGEPATAAARDDPRRPVPAATPRRRPGRDPGDEAAAPVPVSTPFTPPDRGRPPGPAPVFSPVPPGRDDGFRPGIGGPPPPMTPLPR